MQSLKNLTAANSKVTCAHCGVVVQMQEWLCDVYWKDPENPLISRHPLNIQTLVSRGSTTSLTLHIGNCPYCDQPTLTASTNRAQTVIWPTSAIVFVPHQVPVPIAKDYREARLVANLSDNAAAPLTRRCLQAILTEAGFLHRDLKAQIDAALATQLPSHIGETLDAVRIVGNYAAHPTKSSSTGEIIQAEVGEVEWNFYVLDQLFDHFYVKRGEAADLIASVNRKLEAAGNPLLPTRSLDRAAQADPCIQPDQRILVAEHYRNLGGCPVL
jgi:hypothetical protein